MSWTAAVHVSITGWGEGRIGRIGIIFQELRVR